MRSMFLKVIAKPAIAALVMMLFAQAAVFAQAAQEADETSADNIGDHHLNARRIEGVWDARVTIRVCSTGMSIASFQALGVFARGGTFYDTNSTNPVLRSATFGTWSQVRRDKFTFASKFFRFDAVGNNIGSQIIRHQVTLSSSGDQYTSSGTAESYDAAGVLTMTGCSSTTATRFN